MILAAFALVAVLSSGPAMASKESNLGSFIITSDKSLEELETIVAKVCSDAGATGCKVQKIYGNKYRLDLPPGVLDVFTDGTRSGESRFAAASRQIRMLIGKDTKVSPNELRGLY
jgi:hypothetical protein